MLMTDPDHWAVLISTSRGYENYRHQADVCHAYQIMVKRGIPRSHIILFSFDDAAFAAANPFPGQLFSEPDGVDVRNNWEIDYRGTEVSSTNFINAIKGIGEGKVLDATSQSNVFIMMVGHGLVKTVNFWDIKDRLTAGQLHEALVYMHNNQKYGKLHSKKSLNFNIIFGEKKVK